jgi:hypothetical protein
VERMHALLMARSSPSPTAAARQVAAQAAGGGTEASKVTRLVRRYKETHGA